MRIPTLLEMTLDELVDRLDVAELLEDEPAHERALERLAELEDTHRFTLLETSNETRSDWY